MNFKEKKWEEEMGKTNLNEEDARRKDFHEN